jgi:hypothetical protein
MSVVYCEHCDKHIDTDFNAEHFDTPHLDESGDIDLPLYESLVFCFEEHNEDS